MKAVVKHVHVKPYTHFWNEYTYNAIIILKKLKRNYYDMHEIYL